MSEQHKDQGGSADLIPSSAPGIINPDGLWLEDLGEDMRIVTGEYEVTAAEIIDFAGRYDPQVFHLDAERARATFFSGLAASGWLTAGITMRLLVTSGLNLATGMVGLGNNLTWPSATRPGDVLHVEIVIDTITPSASRPDRATVALTFDTVNRDGEIRQHTTGRVLAWKRP